MERDIHTSGGSIGNRTVLEGTDADAVRRFEQLAEEQFNKAEEIKNNFNLFKAYGFLKNGLSQKKVAVEVRITLHSMDKILELLGCD